MTISHRKDNTAITDPFLHAQPFFLCHACVLTLPSVTPRRQSASGRSRANRAELFKLEQSPAAVQTSHHPAKGCCRGQRSRQKRSLGTHLPPSPSITCRAQVTSAVAEVVELRKLPKDSWPGISPGGRGRVRGV